MSWPANFSVSVSRKEGRDAWKMWDFLCSGKEHILRRYRSNWPTWNVRNLFHIQLAYISLDTVTRNTYFFNFITKDDKFFVCVFLSFFHWIFFFWRYLRLWVSNWSLLEVSFIFNSSSLDLFATAAALYKEHFLKLCEMKSVTKKLTKLTGSSAYLL